jgi:hypothetical protein
VTSPPKLENTLALDYPPSHLEIIVTSDCFFGSDRLTSPAALLPAAFRLHRQEERHGKTARKTPPSRKLAARSSSSPTRRPHYRPDVLRLMMPAFA